MIFVLLKEKNNTHQISNLALLCFAAFHKHFFSCHFSMKSTLNILHITHIANRLIILIGFICVGLLSSAQISNSREKEIDELVLRIPKASTKKVETLAPQLNTIGTTDEEKAYTIYSWITHHIKYDVQIYNKNTAPNLEPETVLRTRETICDGYSNLFNALCQNVGLESEKIVGYSKANGYYEGKKFSKPDHSWNAVKYNGQWHFIESTWGAGNVNSTNGSRVFSFDHNTYWFNTPPAQFAMTHFPEDTKWLLLDQNIALTDFQVWPKIESELLQFHVSPDSICNEVMNKKITSQMKVYNNPKEVKFVQIPMQKKLNNGESYTFHFTSAIAQQITLRDGNERIPVPRIGNDFMLDYTPKSKKLEVLVSDANPNSRISVVLEYACGK